MNQDRANRPARAALILLAVALAASVLLLPLAGVFAEALAGGVARFATSLAEPEAVAAIWLTVRVAAISVTVNTVFGAAAAWCLTRQDFRGRDWLETLVELPLSVSPVISGLVWMLLVGAQGWFGPALRRAGIEIVFALPGIVLATVFVTLPFVARPLIPLMRELGRDQEEAAAMLGAGFFNTFFRVTLPEIRWGLLSGVLLCNARAMGEFGAVSVVSGHITGITETIPLRIESLYNEYQSAAAFAMSALLACLAIVTLAAKALLEWRIGRRFGHPA
jgi:sulfate transport system permease protein